MRIPLFGFFGLLLIPFGAEAAYPSITYRHEHHLFTVDPDTQPGWTDGQETWLYRGEPVSPLAEWRVDGDTIPPLPDGVEKVMEADWSRAAIRASLDRLIGAKFNRPAGKVVIRKSASGSVVFEGVGLTGREVDLDAAAEATVRALETGITDVTLRVRITYPEVTVTDPELAAMGIKEVVTVGESDFAGSPVNRRHNISVGLSKFNGHIVPKGATFSFGETLGPVDGSTGYRRELVIKGDRTEPDYGGGLCQVSSTAYRGVWEYGFPIVQRKNHSYAVSYYGPQGTDATVYPPNPDMKFINDSAGALLMQTHQENDRAYFIYYGTRDARVAKVWGPVVLGTRAAPPDRTITTTELPPGVRRKVGDRHAGITVVWYRTIQPVQGEPVSEEILSIYEARPLFYEVGAEVSTPADTAAPVITL